jgi:hypothetical protein
MTAPSAFTTLLSPLRLGTHTVRNRVMMGSMHTRLELLDRAIERQAAFYAERAAAGAALIVTGGYAMNAEGRIDEDAPVLDSPNRPTRCARSRRPCTRTAARSCCRCCTPAATPRCLNRWARPSIPSRINPRACRAGCPAPRSGHDRGLRPLRRAGARSRLRRRGDDGLGGLPAEPVRRHAHQRPRRRLGRQRRPTATAWRWRSCAACASAWGRRA